MPPKKILFQMAEKFNENTVLKDQRKKEWILGPTIGSGGFGAVYSAYQEANKTSRKKTFPYAVKIEPVSNGPLFCEMNFLIRVMKRELIDDWVQKEEIPYLALPDFFGSGMIKYNNKDYRFIVISRFDKDLQSILIDNDNILPNDSIFKIAVFMIDALHYIHSNNYVHADVKAGNILISNNGTSTNRVYLIDFGMVMMISKKIDLKKDPKTAHNGTPEYISRDMHLGVPTRRGDLEMLGYNLIHWANSSLPWQNSLTDPEKVAQQKNKLFENIGKNMTQTFPKVSKVLHKFMEFVSNINHLEIPDYKACRNIFIKELDKLKIPLNGPLNFKNVKDDNKTKSQQSRSKKLKLDEAGSSSQIDKAVKSPKTFAKKLKTDVKKENLKKRTWRDAPLLSTPPSRRKSSNLNISKIKNSSENKSDVDISYKKSNSAKSKKKKTWRDAPLTATPPSRKKLTMKNTEESDDEINRNQKTSSKADKALAVNKSRNLQKFVEERQPSNNSNGYLSDEDLFESTPELLPQKDENRSKKNVRRTTKKRSAINVVTYSDNDSDSEDEQQNRNIKKSWRNLNTVKASRIKDPGNFFSKKKT